MLLLNLCFGCILRDHASNVPSLTSLHNFIRGAPDLAHGRPLSDGRACHTAKTSAVTTTARTPTARILINAAYTSWHNLANLLMHASLNHPDA